MTKAQSDMDAQQGQGFTEFQHRSSQTKLVIALRERDTQKRYLDAALKADPAVAEAHRRWVADTHSPKSSIGQIVEGLAYEPCALVSAGKPGEGQFTLEGVTLGMDRSTAVNALCAARKGDVMLAREEVKRSHLGDYRDFGFSPNSQLPELPWTMMVPFSVMGGDQVRYNLGKSYQARAQYCFGCKPERAGMRPEGYAQTRDAIELNFLPNGKLGGLTRTQFFGQMVRKSSDNGISLSSWAPVPRPLKSLLAPLQQRFGPPSFIWSSGERPVFGWVFPDGKAVLPQEKWFLTHATSFDMIQLNSPGLIFDGQVYSRKKLAAARPRAAYCLNRHSNPWGNASYLAGKYFTYDAKWAANDAYMAARQAGKPMATNTPIAYNARYEAPGFVDRCGVVITATFAKDDNISDNRGTYESAVEPLSLEAPIYRLTVKMIDTNLARTSFVAEEQAVRKLFPSQAAMEPAFVATPAAASSSAQAASQQAGNLKAREYGAWKACLYKRLRNRFEYDDEVRCQALDPQGRVPRR